MTERYYSVDYEEQYYIFDSETISKDKVEEESEYSYTVFADSLSSKEIIDLLNENEQLKQEVGFYKTLLQSLKEQAEKISQIR